MTAGRSSSSVPEDGATRAAAAVTVTRTPRCPASAAAFKLTEIREVEPSLPRSDLVVDSAVKASGFFVPMLENSSRAQKLRRSDARRF